MLGLAYTGYASWLANAEHGADPREFLVSTQSSVDVEDVRDEVVALARAGARACASTIDRAEGATFPWAWYFRDLDAGYLDLSSADEPPETDVAGPHRRPAATGSAAQLTGFDGRQFRFRVWWVREYGEQSPSNWPRWFAEREPWNPTGGMPEWLYVRRAVTGPPGPAQAAPTPIVPSRSNTRRPRTSHFASPASPWSVRSIGPTTT